MKEAFFVVGVVAVAALFAYAYGYVEGRKDEEPTSMDTYLQWTSPEQNAYKQGCSDTLKLWDEAILRFSKEG